MAPHDHYSSGQSGNDGVLWPYSCPSDHVWPKRLRLDLEVSLDKMVTPICKSRVSTVIQGGLATGSSPQWAFLAYS
jgi:hypothetical protein